jgi:hypothetical protein
MGAEPGQCSPGGRRYHGFSGPVAQLVEQGTFNPKVVGSIPTRPIFSAGILRGRVGGEAACAYRGSTATRRKLRF